MNLSNFEMSTWTLSMTNTSDFETCIENINDVAYLILVLFSTLSCLLAVVGNASILWAFHKNKSLRNVSNNFVMSLCSSDLITGLLVNPLSVAMATLLRFGKEHERLESFLFYFLGVVLIATTLTLSTVSVDRFIAVVHPLRYKELVTERKSVCIIISTWVFAAIVASPRLFFLQEDAEQIILGSIVISLSIPLVITVYCYFKILVEARKQVVSPTTSAVNTAYRTLKNKKTTVTMAMILGLFIVVYTPLFVFAALALSGLHLCHTHVVGDWLWPTFVVCASAALNPLVYGIRNMMIRNSLKKIFKNNMPKRQIDGKKSARSCNASVIEMKPKLASDIKNKRTNERTNKQMSEQANERTDTHTHGRTHGRTHARTKN